MFANRQNNQKDNRFDVNTRGYQFMNAEAKEPSTLQIGSWNEMMSLRINPALEPSKRTEGRMFDYERNVSTSLTAENAMILLNNIKKCLIPAMERDEEASVGVAMNNGSSLLVLSSGKRLLGEISPILIIYKNLNADTKKPEMSMSYEFRKNVSIDEYNETTGQYVLNSNHGEFYLFIKLLESYLMHCGKFDVHFWRLVNKGLNDRNVNALNAIADKVGASVDYGRSNSRYQPKQNIFSNNNTYHAEDTSSDTIGDISELSDLLD